jgi:glyoxylase-like metal-dependent hydrolase (beta-lactamase superfamily II)
MDAVYRSSRPARLHRLSRRQVPLDLGWGGVAVAVLAGCSTGSPSSTGSGNAATSGAAATTTTAASSGELARKRVDVGFVSAYLLVRGTSVAIVDTGVAGSADAIGTALRAASSDGHLSAFDRGTRVLVAGDALGNTAGLTRSNPQFTSDPAKATESVKTLAALDADTILFGHGEPLTSGAAEALRTFASTL